jgi:phosphoglycerate kinase
MEALRPRLLKALYLWSLVVDTCMHAPHPLIPHPSLHLHPPPPAHPQVCLLENLRFHPGEAANDDAFARALARLGRVYVNDAFGAVHRDQASITVGGWLVRCRGGLRGGLRGVGVQQPPVCTPSHPTNTPPPHTPTPPTNPPHQQGVLPYFDECYPGPLLRDELRYLHTACSDPRRPFGVVIGGAKVKDKLAVLSCLIEKADVILIGGRMAFTFLAAGGVSVGKTQIEEEWLEVSEGGGGAYVRDGWCVLAWLWQLTLSLPQCRSFQTPRRPPTYHQPCRAMMARASERGVTLLLPSDVVVARSLDDSEGCCTVALTPGCCTQDSPCVPEGEPRGCFVHVTAAG